MTMQQQARTAYAAALDALEATGLGPADVVRVTESVSLAGLDDYENAAAVRREVFGAHEPALCTVVVEGLLGPADLLEVELGADGHDGTVHLPTMLPLDDRGDVVHPGDFVGQYAHCLDRAGTLLESVGLSLDHAVTTYDYSTPATRDVYRRSHRVRKERLGGAGVFPGAGGILMSRLHAPGVLVAIDVTASRHPLELVNPGWSRYDSLTYAPGVRAGELLHMSGFAALDMDTQEALHPGDLGAQAESTYAAILLLLEHAGLGPGDLVGAQEFVVASAVPDHRVVGDVRRRLGVPTATGAVCAELLRPEFLLEVFPTARYPTSPVPS